MLCDQKFTFFIGTIFIIRTVLFHHVVCKHLADRYNYVCVDQTGHGTVMNHLPVVLGYPVQEMKAFVTKWMTAANWFNSFPHLNKMAAISQTIFSDAFSLMKSFVFRLKFHWRLFLRVPIDNNPALVWIMAWRRIGDETWFETIHPIHLLRGLLMVKPATFFEEKHEKRKYASIKQNVVDSFWKKNETWKDEITPNFIYASRYRNIIGISLVTGKT